MVLLPLPSQCSNQCSKSTVRPGKVVSREVGDPQPSRARVVLQSFLPFLQHRHSPAFAPIAPWRVLPQTLSAAPESRFCSSQPPITEARPAGRRTAWAPDVLTHARAQTTAGRAPTAHVTIHHHDFHFSPPPVRIHDGRARSAAQQWCEFWGGRIQC
jgi:hypothetical protein